MPRWVPSWVAIVGTAAACAAPRPPSGGPAANATAPTPAAAAPRVITVVGTNDVHGHLRRLPVFAGYLERLRELRASDGGVLLVDAGDAFQGTLESNLNEGRAVVDAYAALGYHAVAVGNHEFDYGPVGDDTGGDIFGALKARIAESQFPWLAANLVDTAKGARPDWKNLRDSALVEVGGVTIGLVGVLTAETPEIVMPAYFAGLSVASPAEALTREARALRAAGAQVVVAVAHAGGECQKLDDPSDLASCDADAEIVKVTRALPQGLVDVIVGGHTHKAMAHVVDGVAVVEAYSYARAFSRVDLLVDVPSGKARIGRVHAPRELCSNPGAPICEAGDYEGRRIQPSSRLQAAIAPALESARRVRDEPLGAEAQGAILRSFDRESDLGNLFSDLLLAHAPDAQFALLNGGGLRADLPTGKLTYGHVYEAMPFDNRVARIELSGAELTRVLARHLTAERHGIVSIAGLRVVARCIANRLDVQLLDSRGRPLSDSARVVVVTSDYLATGGDALFQGVVAPGTPRIDAETTLRDAFAAGIRRQGQLRAGERLDPKRPRLTLPTPRPVRCQ